MLQRWLPPRQENQSGGGERSSQLHVCKHAIHLVRAGRQAEQTGAAGGQAARHNALRENQHRSLWAPRPGLPASCSSHQKASWTPSPSRVGAAELFALQDPRDSHGKMPKGKVPVTLTAGKPEDALHGVGVTVTIETE